MATALHPQTMMALDFANGPLPPAYGSPLKLKLNTANPEVVDCERESGKFRVAWHHAAAARAGAAVARMRPRVAA
jgi:hypothetical protein